MPAKAPVIITKSDISVVKHRIEDHGETVKDPRLALKQQSKQKAANWNQTIKNGQQEKLQKRQERLDKEEQQRRVVDAQFAAEKLIERQALLSRAEQMKFCDNDKVRIIHSQVINDMVLHEREEQIRRKKAMKQKWKENADVWTAINNQIWDKKAEEERKKAEDALVRLQQCTDEQYKQMLAKADEKKQEKQEYALEGELVRKQTEEWKTQQHQKEEKNLNEQKKRMEELVRMRKEAAEREARAKQEKVEYLQQLVRDQEEEDAMKKLRHDVEVRYQKELVERRDQIAAEQKEWLEMEAKKKADWVDLRILEVANGHEKKMQEKARQKQLLAEETKKFFDTVLETKKMTLAKKKEDDIKTREKLKTLLEQLEVEKVSKKEKARETSRMIEATYAKQLEERQRQKQQEVDLIYADKAAWEKEGEEEEKRLLGYIESLLEEKWMISNPHKKSAAEYLKVVKSLSK